MGVAGGAFCLHVSDFEFELAGCGWELDERWLGAATSWLAGWLLQPSHIPPAKDGDGCFVERTILDPSIQTAYHGAPDDPLYSFAATRVLHWIAWVDPQLPCGGTPLHVGTCALA